jgi:hypothetical protein
MTNITRYFLCALLTLVVVSCRDDSKDPYPEVTRSSIPLFNAREGDTGFVNFLNLDETMVSFDVTHDGKEEVTRIDVFVTYNNTATGTSETISYSQVSSFPQTFTFDIDQLIGLFPTNVVTRDTLSLGDSFVVWGQLLMKDGRYVSGFSPSIVAKFPVFLTYNVACESDLAGTYDFELISGDNGEVESLGNQTIRQITPGYYEISDITMDLFGPDFPIKYRFRDICGTLIPDASSIDFPTLIFIKFNAGTAVDEDAGVITFAIEYAGNTCCGVAGIKTVFKATRK